MYEVRRPGVPLVDPDAHERGQRARDVGEERAVVFVDAAGEEGREDRAAARGDGFEAGGEVALDHVQDRGEDHVVRREVGGDRDDVDVRAGLAGGPVVGMDDLLVLHQPGGAEGRVAEEGQLAPELGHFTEDRVSSRPA